MSRKRAFTFHPDSRNSTASQSSSFGFVGGSPVMPNSPAVGTRPCPKTCAQKRLTLTRAVSGWSGWVSHRASPRRLAGAPSGSGGRTAGTAAGTLSPSWSYWPRMRMCAKGSWPFFSSAMSVTFDRAFTASNSPTSGVARVPKAPRVGVDEGEVVVPQRLQLLRGPLARLRGEHRFERAAAGEHLHLRERQGAPIETDVVDGRAFRPLAGAAPVEPQRRLRADGPAERIHFLVDELGLAVVVDLDALGLPRAVVGDEDVVPPFRLHGGPRQDPQRVLVPGADDLDSGAAALHPEVPAAVAVRDVHAGQERAVDGVGDLDPGAAREGLVGLDVAQIAQIGGDARRPGGPPGPGATSRPAASLR